jgi:phospholipase/carboxylesterase
LLVGGAGAILGCGSGISDGSDGQARLTARPGTPTGSVSPGTIRLGSGDVHDGYLYVPAGYHAAIPTPLLLALHGAGGNITGPLGLLGPYAEAQNFLIVAVNSADYTWDGVLGRYGTDVAIIDQALHRAFERCNVDAARVVLEGFSDGASYALGLGIANGGLFSRVIAFSPGFLHESGSSRQGKPGFFFSHGRQDPVLSIDTSSRVLVPQLQADGYQVTYREFDGGHLVPADVAQAAVSWMLA